MSTTDKELLLRKYNNILKINKKKQPQHKITFKLKKSEQAVNAPSGGSGHWQPVWMETWHDSHNEMCTSPRAWWLRPECALQGFLTRPSTQSAQGCALERLCGKDLEEV